MKTPAGPGKGKKMTEREKKARRQAHEFIKANTPWWDLEEDYDSDKLDLVATPAEIAGYLVEYFGDDAPADIIRDLQAC